MEEHNDLKLIPGVIFTIILQAAFMLADPKSEKNQAAFLRFWDLLA